MTDNTQELDEVLTKLENAVALNIGSQGMRGEAPKRSHWKAKQAILDWRNKQIEKAVSADEFLNYLFRNGYVDREWDAKELEDTLNELKESK